MDLLRALPLLPCMVAFAKVVETGSFTAAARLLDATPSAVSRQVARLERELGVRLLQRTTRQLRLSEAGREVLGHCRQLLAAAGAALDSGLQHSEEPRGQVRLAVPKAVGYRLIAPLLPEFFQRYPQVDLQLRLDDRPLDPIADDQDLLVRITEQPPAGFVARPLRKMDFVLCASPAYLQRRGTPQQPQALAEHDCLYLGETPGDQRWQLRHGDRVESVTVRGRLACNHSGVRLEATLADLGIACLPAFAAEAGLAVGSLRRVLPDWQYLGPYQGTAWLLYPPDRQLPAAVRVLVDFLLERLRSAPGSG